MKTRKDYSPNLFLKWDTISSYKETSRIGFLFKEASSGGFNDLLFVCSYVGACVHEGQLHPLTEVSEYVPSIDNTVLQEIFVGC